MTELRLVRQDREKLTPAARRGWELLFKTNTKHTDHQECCFERQKNQSAPFPRLGKKLHVRQCTAPEGIGRRGPAQVQPRPGEDLVSVATLQRQSATSRGVQGAEPRLGEHGKGSQDSGALG